MSPLHPGHCPDIYRAAQRAPAAERIIVIQSVPCTNTGAWSRSARTCGVISSHLAGHQLTLRLLVSNTKLQQRHHPYTDMTRDSRPLSGHHLATHVWRVGTMRAMQQLTLLRCQGRCGAGWLMVAGGGNGEDSIRHDLVSMVR